MLKPILISATLAAAMAPTASDAALVALYTFDDAAALGLDSSGNGRDATNFGATFAAAGYQGGAARFQGAEWLRAPVAVSRTALPQMTWGAWVKPSVLGGIQPVLSNDDGGFDRQIGIDNRLGAGWAGFTGTGVLSTSILPSAGQWTFLAAVYDQSQSRMTIYVDGQSVGAQTSFGASPNALAIGRNLSFPIFFNGMIDNVFVYDEALSAARIADLRATGFPGAAVPEPATWALMVAGFGLAGAGLRRRTARTAVLA